MFKSDLYLAQRGQSTKVVLIRKSVRSQSTARESRNLDHDKSCALKCKSGLPVRAVNFYDLIKVGKDIRG